MLTKDTRNSHYNIYVPPDNLDNQSNYPQHFVMPALARTHPLPPPPKGASTHMQVPPGKEPPPRVPPQLGRAMNAQAPLASSQGKSPPPLVALAKPKPAQLSAEAPLQVKPQVKPQSPPGALPPHMHTYMYPKPQADCLERGLQIAGPGYIDHRTSGLPAFVPGKRPAPQPPPAKTVPLAS